jgi:hypothetical protein
MLEGYRIWILGAPTHNRDSFEEWMVAKRQSFIVHDDMYYIAKGQHTLERLQEVRRMAERGELL